MKKVFTLIAVVCAVVLALLIVLRLVEVLSRGEAETKRASAPITVLLERATVGTIRDVGSFTGSLEADSTFTVSPKVAGRVTEVNFKLGDKVSHGDVVARLDDREQLLAVQEQQAALLVAQAEVDSAVAEVEKAIVEIRSEEAGVESAKAQIEAAEVSVENAEVNVQSELVQLKSTLVKIKNAQNDVTTARNTIASEQANLAGAEAQLNLARQNLEREQKGLRDETSSQAELDAAQANFDVQSANVKVAAAKLATARNSLAIAETEVEMAENDRDVAQSKVDIARSNLKIAQTSVTIAKTDLVNAQAKVANAKTAKTIADKRVVIAREQVRKQEAVLDAARERHSYTIIRAEWRKDEGSPTRFVAERLVDPGALLAVNAPIMAIIDSARLKVAVTAVERDFARLSVGQQADVFVQVSQDGNPRSPENAFTGTIIRKAPVIDDASRQGRFEIEIDNADGRLHPGAFARIDIVFATRTDAIILKEDAIVTRDDRTGVFVSQNQPDGTMTAAFVPVTVGIRSGTLVEAIASTPEDRRRLADGRIVTMGNHLLKDGAAIRLPEQGAWKTPDADVDATPAPAPSAAP